MLMFSCKFDIFTAFVRSGYIRLSNVDGNTFGLASINGFMWSMLAVDYTSSALATAYYLEYRSTDVRTSFASNRYFGLPSAALVLY